MPEPRWRDVDMKGSCSHCGGTHFGTGLECPFREENMGEPCVVCGERTCYCCSDCGIDSAGREKVYVCTKDACRAEHEKRHPDTKTQTVEGIAAAIHSTALAILLLDGDRDHMNKSDMTCEMTQAIAGFLKRAALDLGFVEGQ